MSTITITSTVISADGTPIGYERAGTGTALVLVDGALVHRAAGPGRPLAALLSSDFAVHTYDRRGRGESGDLQPYDVDREIEDLAAVIEEAGGSAYVYGMSSGANLVLRAAASGLDIAALALWEANFLVDDSRPPLPADYVAHLEELVTADRREDAVEYFMTAAVGVPAEFVAPMRGTPVIASMAASAHTIAYDGRIVDGFTLGTRIVAGVTTRTMVLDGGTTPWLSAGARALADTMPAATRRTLAGQQHDVAPEAVAPALIEFFSRCS
jgi:pimeloyl-ACP methyl ester carboxylesterase